MVLLENKVKYLFVEVLAACCRELLLVTLHFVNAFGQYLASSKCENTSESNSCNMSYIQ